MLLRRKDLDGIRAGTIRLAFRRWKRPTVRAGGTLKTALGVLAIDAVERVLQRDITERDARLAGHDSRAALLAELRKRTGDVYRIELRHVGADPRVELRGRATLPRAERDELLARLARMDARARGGPWTARVLALLRDHPGVRAADLAPEVGRETLAFKRDVRKLKELGLTVSLETGYELSPRGARVLRELER
ncbi:MAG: hypothetical protein AAF682_10855 [Planctomycetota bacterium]